MARRKVLKLVTQRVQANEDTVSLLEHMLDEAKRGEVESVAVAYVRSDRSIGHHWSSSYVGTLLGSVSRLQYALNRAADDESKS